MYGEEEMNKHQFIKDFLKAIEDGKTGNEIMEFYHPEIIQTEYPNFLLPKTMNRNFGDISSASESGSKVLISQTYEIVQFHDCENTVILESIWRGKLAIPFKHYNVGDEMTAYFTQIYEFKDGKIYRQKNYDCFETA